jgi:hypothetical protein
MVDDDAAAYNRVSDELATNPIIKDGQILINATSEDMDVYNKVANVINALIELNHGGLDYKEEDIPSNHMVKVQ